MLYSALAVAVFGLSWSATAAGTSSKAKPECVDKCWTNSQYVSLCMGDHQCLCDDSEFQNAVYQCLYSQCSTSKFGTALHHALQACHREEEEIHEEVIASPVEMHAMEEAHPTPAPFRMDENLKQRRNTQSASNSNSVFRPMRSVTRSNGQSVSASAHMTYPTGRAKPTASVSASNYMSVHHTSRARPSQSVSASNYMSAYPTSRARGSQSVSASNYMSAYPTSRARGSQSVSASNYMSVYPTSRARGSQSVSASNYMSAYPTSRARGTQSVSASNYMTKVTSRAKPTASVSASNYMTMSRSRGRPSGSVSASNYMTMSRSRGRPTASVSASNYMSYPTSRAKTSMRMITQITDGQIQAPTAAPKAKRGSEH